MRLLISGSFRRSSVTVATNREGRRLPKSGRASHHRAMGAGDDAGGTNASQESRPQLRSRVLFGYMLREILTAYGTPTLSLDWNGTLTKWGAMAVTHTKAEEFRRLAQECRATAQTLSTEQARAEMLAMADVCDPVVA